MRVGSRLLPTAATAGVAPPARARTGSPARGFTLIEVLIAMSLLLVGGVSVLSVFTLAVVHRVERDVEAKVDLLRPEVKTLAQDAVDGAKKGLPPGNLVEVATSQPGFTLSVSFEKSPNGEPAWVARPTLSYRGKVLRQGRVPPIWLSRSTFDPRR
jgi:prepilin-type N-terminal cleavage/methylation domain-containing protein